MQRHYIGTGLADDEPIDSGASIEVVDGRLEQSTGFIVDRTITNFGAQFVREYAQAWRAEENTAGIDLTIVEKPSARWGSTILIEYNSHALARIFLQAGRSAAIKPLAENAVHYVAGKVADNSLLGLLTLDPDLGKDELPN
jgi:curli production assembly/transport component CsgE